MLKSWSNTTTWPKHPHAKPAASCDKSQTLRVPPFENASSSRVAIEELRKAKEKLAKGIAPESGRGPKYEDICALLIADYTDKGKIEMVDGEMMISGRGGRLKALDDYFVACACGTSPRT